MSTVDAHLNQHELPPEPEKATLEGRNKVLGFWLFLGGETVLFGTLFATYLALRAQVLDEFAPGVELFAELISLPLVAIATLILLTSSLTSVLAIQAMHANKIKNMLNWLIVTVVLGLGFLGLEIYEFSHYVHENHGFTTSAFSSAFYALVGFHGAHVAFGVVWISIITAQAYKQGLTTVTAPKIYVASLYWHFIDVVWVFIFTVVYLMGVII
jgi:cytochrome c oxidase subunit 3